MRLALFASLLVLAGCAHAPAPASAPLAAAALAARAKADPNKPGPAMQAALDRWSKVEKRTITVERVPLNNGHSGATLKAPLNSADQAVLIQLYRLNPRPSDTATWPTDLFARSADHIAELANFALPDATPLKAEDVQKVAKPRQYMQGNGKVWAFETFFQGPNYRILGKYDLRGRIMQVDMDIFTSSASK